MIILKFPPGVGSLDIVHKAEERCTIIYFSDWGLRVLFDDLSFSQCMGQPISAFEATWMEGNDA